MVPFGIFQVDFSSLNDLPRDGLLEKDLHLPTLPESSLNPAYLLAFVDTHLLPHEVLQMGLFIEQVLHNYGVGVNYPIHCPCLVLLLK